MQVAEGGKTKWCLSILRLGSQPSRARLYLCKYINYRYEMILCHIKSEPSNYMENYTESIKISNYLLFTKHDETLKIIIMKIVYHRRTNIAKT